MGIACFVHQERSATLWEWITVSGKHEAMRWGQFMPVWSKKMNRSFGLERICLDGRTVRLVRKPIASGSMVFGAKIEYVIEALEEVAEIKLVNIDRRSGGEKEKYLPIYVNISNYEKPVNVLASRLERVTAYMPFSPIFTATKTISQIDTTANQILRDLGLKNRRIRLTITGHKQEDTRFKIENEGEFTFGDLAEMLRNFTNKEYDEDEVRKLFDELFRNGVSIISGLA